MGIAFPGIGDEFFNKDLTMTENAQQLRMTVYASLFAALITAGAYIFIPIGPIPIVLQNMFVLLTGLLLGPRWGLASVGVYLLAGLCGLPVFAGGTGGIGRLFGPTGGYLIGYLPGVFLAGWISKKGNHQPVFDVLAMIAAMIAIYGLGVSWLQFMSGMSPGKSLAVGMVPFLPGDAVKIAAAVAIARTLRPVIQGNLMAAQARKLA